MAVTRKLGELFWAIRAKTEGLSQDIAKAEAELGKLAGFVRTHPAAAAASLGVALAGIGATALTMAAQVDTAMRQIGAALPTGTKGLDQLRTDLQQFAKDTGRLSGEVQAAALATAQEGVAGPEELMVRLKAVGRLADVVGGDLATRSREAERIMGIFNIQSKDWEASLAKLWAATRGKASWDEMVAAITAGSRGVRGVKGDFDVATKAISALLSAEYQMRDIRTIINKATPDQLRELASLADDSSDALGELRRQSDNVQQGAGRMAQAMREELHSQLVDLGMVLLPTVLDAMREFKGLLAGLSGQHHIGVDVAITGTALGEKLSGGMAGLQKFMAKLADTLDPMAWPTGWASGDRANETGYEALARKAAERATRAADDAAARARDATRSLTASYNKSFLDIQAGAKQTGAALDADLFSRTAAATPAVGPLYTTEAKRARAEALASGLLGRAPARERAGGKSETERLTDETKAFEAELANLAASLTRTNPFDDIATSFGALGAKAAALDAASHGATNFAATVARLREQAIALAQADIAQRIQALTDQLTDAGAAIAATPFTDITQRVAGFQRAISDLALPPDKVLQFRVQVESLRQALLDVEKAKLGQVVDEVRIRESTTLVDDLTAAYDLLLKRFETAPATAGQQANIAYLRALREGSVTAQASIEETTDALGAMVKAAAASKTGLIDADQIALLTTGARLMQAITESTTADVATRARAKAVYDDIVRTLREQATLTQEQLGRDKDGTKEQQQHKTLLDQQLTALQAIGAAQGVVADTGKKIAAGLSDQVRYLLEAVSAAAQLAEAMGVVDDRTQQTIAAATQLGLGIAEAIGGEGEQGAMNILAGLTGIITTLTGNSAADQQRRRELASNTDAIHDLTAHIGDLSRTSVSGTVYADVKAGIQALIDATGNVGGFRRFGQKGSPLRSMDPKEFLESLGLDWADVLQLAKEYNITLNGTKQSYLDLLEVLNKIDFAVFLRSFEGALSILEDRFTFEGIEGAKDKLDALIALLAGPDGAPALFGALRDLDTTTAEGRAAAKQAILNIFNGIVAGTIDFEAFGALNPEQLREVLKRLFALIGDVATEAAEAAAREAEQRAREASEAAAARARALGELDEAFDVAGADAAERLRRLNEFFVKQFAELGQMLEGLDFATPADIDAARDRLRTLFETLLVGGIDDTERELANAVKALLGALDDVAAGLQSFADQLTAAFSDIDLEARVFGESLPATLGKKLTRLGLATFDISTAAGQAAVLAQLQALFGTSDAETKQVIADLIDSLRRVMEDTARAGADAAALAATATGPSVVGQVELTQRQGVEVTDLLRTLTLIGRDQLLALQDIRTILLGSVPGALIRPPTLGLGGTAASATTLLLNMPVTVAVNTAVPDGVALGRDIGRGIRSEVDRMNTALGGSLALDRRRAGRVDLT